MLQSWSLAFFLSAFDPAYNPAVHDKDRQIPGHFYITMA
jgi:hypothetical protein